MRRSMRDRSKCGIQGCGGARLAQLHKKHMPHRFSAHQASTRPHSLCRKNTQLAPTVPQKNTRLYRR